MKDIRETYTFSRALHMMRYGGKKMQPLHDNWIYFVENETLMVLPNSRIKQKVIYEKSMGSDDIMASWVEVK